MKQLLSVNFYLSYCGEKRYRDSSRAGVYADRTANHGHRQGIKMTFPKRTAVVNIALQNQDESLICCTAICQLPPLNYVNSQNSVVSQQFVSTVNRNTLSDTWQISY